MHEIRTKVERPDETLVEAFESFPSPVLSDVMDKNRQTMNAGINPVHQNASIVGTAVTVDACAGDNLILHKAMDLANEGDVLVVDANGYPEAGIWGELMTMTAQKRGICGTVIDGGVRDINDVAELNYPLFARHVSPKGSAKSQPGSINVSVSCGGVVVNPGDIIVGDRDGVAVVPSEQASLVKDEAERKFDAEASARSKANTTANYAKKFEEILDPLEQNGQPD